MTQETTDILTYHGKEMQKDPSNLILRDVANYLAADRMHPTPKAVSTIRVVTVIEVTQELTISGAMGVRALDDAARLAHTNINLALKGRGLHCSEVLAEVTSSV